MINDEGWLPRFVIGKATKQSFILKVAKQKLRVWTSKTGHFCTVCRTKINFGSRSQGTRKSCWENACKEPEKLEPNRLFRIITFLRCSGEETASFLKIVLGNRPKVIPDRRWAICQRRVLCILDRRRAIKKVSNCPGTKREQIDARSTRTANRFATTSLGSNKIPFGNISALCCVSFCRTAKPLPFKGSVPSNNSFLLPTFMWED